MQRRPWVLIVALLSLALVYSAIIGTRYLNRSNKLKHEILNILSDIPGDFDISRATIESSTLILSNFQYSDPEKRVKVDVEHISVRFSVSNWLTHSREIEAVVQSISIDKPVVTVNIDRDRGRSSNQNDSSGTSKKLDLLSFSALEGIIIQNGQFNFRDNNNLLIFGMTEFAGWVMSGNNDEANFSFAASSENSDSETIKFEGNVDLKNLIVNSTFDINNLSFEDIGFPSSIPLKKSSGIISLIGEIEYDSIGVTTNADVKLENFSTEIKGGPSLKNLNLDMRVEDNLAKAEGTLIVEEDHATISMSCDYSDGIQLDAKMDVEKFELGKFLGKFARLSVKYQPIGTFKTEFNYTLNSSSKEWSATGRAVSPKLETYVGIFNDVNIELSWDRSDFAMSIDTLTAKWYGMDVNGFGRFRPGRDDRFPVDLHVTGDVDPTRFPQWASPLSTKSTETNVKIRFRPDTKWVLRGDGYVRDKNNRALGEFLGFYSNTGYDLQLNLFPINRSNATARLTSSSGEPINLITDQPHVLAEWWDKETYGINERLYNIDTWIDCDFYKDRITGAIRVIDPATKFMLETDGTLRINDPEQLKGMFGLDLFRDNVKVGNGDTDFYVEESILKINSFNFMDYLSTTGSIDFKKKTFDEFKLIVNDLPINELTSRLTSIPEEQLGGGINGMMDITGPFENPQISSHFELYEGRFRSLEHYWGLLTLGTDISGNLFVRQGAFGRGETILLRMNGAYNILEDQLGLLIESPGTDANALMMALLGREDMVAGEIAFRSNITGSLLYPEWNSQLTMNEAKVTGIEFDNIKMNFHGVTNQRLGHVFYIDEFVLNKVDHYSLTVSGAAPLKKGAGQISIAFDGRIMEVFPQLTPFIKSADGSGNLIWNITVVGGKIAATQGEISINDGNFDFEDVFPDISDINVDINIDIDGNADIKRFDGIVGKKYPLVLRNEIIEGTDSELQSIIVDEIGVNLGVIKFATPDDKGIPIRFPGISTTKDFASMKFAGKENDWFVISGPVDSLLMSGTVSLANARITYPAIISSNGGSDSTSSPVIELLNNAKWDAEIQLHQGIQYERELRGFENTPGVQAVSDLIGQVASDFNISDLFGRIALEIKVEPTDESRPIKVSGRLADESLRLYGDVISTSGKIEFLDLNFEVEHAEMNFDTRDILPLVSGRAKSEVDELTNISGASGVTRRNTYLTLYLIDPVTGEKTPRGRWGDFTIVLEDDQGSSQENVLSSLGFDEKILENKAASTITGGLDRAITRTWLRPIEREVANLLNLDMVRIHPSFAQNLFGVNDTLSTQANSSIQDYFNQSRIVLGKYLNRDLFISYTGQLGNDPRYAAYDNPDARSGFLQIWSIEYRIREISPNFVLQWDWEKNYIGKVENKEVEKTSLRVKYMFTYDLSTVNWNAIFNKIRYRVR
jgi:TamB, inner membrane protein subunit of TAM complex